MKIKDIFSKLENVKPGFIKSSLRRMTSDINGLGGATMEEQIIVNFNQKNKNHKLINMKMLENIDLDYDFGSFATDLQDLQIKTKKTFTKTSAADFLLFEKNKDVYKLVDCVSLKTSLTDNKNVPCFFHNDAKGEIYDAFTKQTNSLTSDFCSVIMGVKRENKVKLFYFEGKLNKFFEGAYIVKENKHKDLMVGYKKGEEVICDHAFKLINKNAKTGNQSTSYRRGLQITCKKTKKVNFFDVLDSMVSLGILENILEFEIDSNAVKKELRKQFLL